jgi:prepilin-type N-terminal cleavage/methylation domain-containing protein
MKHPRPPAARRRPARGFSMIECLVSMSMLGFGLLELVSFEGRLIGQGTEAQHRMTATLLADELLNPRPATAAAKKPASAPPTGSSAPSRPCPATRRPPAASMPRATA